jgi:hypothetical protein
MSRRRWILLGSIATLLLVGAEVAFRQWESPKACVQIVNEADGPMEDLIVSYADTRISLGRLGAGEKTSVYLTAGPRGPLQLDYRQNRNGLGGFQVPDFDPLQNRKDAFKLVVVVRTNEVQRYMDDDASAQNQVDLIDQIKRWIGTEPMP